MRLAPTLWGIISIAVLAAAAMGACNFNAIPLPVGGDSGALPDNPPGTPDVRTYDAPPIDAYQPPVDMCPSTSTALTVATGSIGSNIDGTIASSGNQFAPVCDTQTSGDETFYHVDFTNQTGTNDLVAETDEGTSGLDPILDINSTCGSSTGTPDPTEACVDAGTMNLGEFVVSPQVTNGRKYIVVDSYSGSGAYRMHAWLRVIRTATQSCDAPQRLARCTSGTYCFAGACAAAASTVVENGTVENNATAVTATANQAAVNGDGVFTGTLTNSSDVDFVKLTPAANSKVRLTLFTDSVVGCSADLRLAFYTGANAADDIDNNPTNTSATDDNSGIGPCPLIDTSVSATGVTFVKITAGSSLITGSPTYTLVIDYHN